MVLRVRLEIVPHGEEDQAYEIGRIDIFNKGEDPTGYHAYGVINLTPNDTGLYREEIYHKRTFGAWELARNAISALGIDGPASDPPFRRYKVVATQGQGMMEIAEFNSLEGAIEYVENHQSEASFGITYPNGEWHAWDKPKRS